jgi:hypothetical protein
VLFDQASAPRIVVLHGDPEADQRPAGGLIMVFVLVFLLLAAIILGMSSGAVMDDINHCDTQYPKLSNVSDGLRVREQSMGSEYGLRVREQGMGSEYEVQNAVQNEVWFG